MYKQDYYRKNRKKIISQIVKWQNKEYKNNQKYRTTIKARTLFRNIIKGTITNSNTLEKYLGYNTETLINHLVKTLPEGYSLLDASKGRVVLDHIIPIKYFNYTSYSSKGFRKCWNYRNLRLVPEKENQKKYDTLNPSLIEAYGIQDLLK